MKTNQVTKGGNIQLNNVQIYVERCTFQSNRANEFGGVLDTLANVQLNVNFSSFIENQANLYAGAVSLSGKTTSALFQNCIFQGNSAQNGGAFFLTQNSKATLQDCQANYNKAEHYGGFIYVESQSQIQIYNSYIQLNQCSVQGSALFLLSTLQENKISDSIISNNEAASATIQLFKSSIELDQIELYENYALNTTGGISGIISTITISNSVFSKQEKDYGAFINVQSQSILQIKNSTFKEGYATNGGAIYALFSKLDIQLSTFSTKGETGGVINGNNMQIISQGNYYISEDQKGSIYCSSCSFVSISDTFEYYYPRALYLIDSNSVLITNSNFFHGYSKMDGGAIYLQSISAMKINGANFFNNTGGFGGCIYYTDEFISKLNDQAIELSTFDKCKSQYEGGAIYIKHSKIDLSFNNFYNNIALGQKEQKQNARGGAIRTICLNQECEYNFNQNTFINNSAEFLGEGGAISWKNRIPKVTPDISDESYFCKYFKNNKAEYGNEIASEITFLGHLQDIKNNTFNQIPNCIQFHQKNPNKDSETNIRRVSSQDNVQVAPGQALTNPIYLILMDTYGQQIFTSNNSELQFQIQDANIDAFVSGTQKFFSKKGLFNASGLIITSKPGSQVNIKMQVGDINKTLAKINDPYNLFNMTPTIFPINLRFCKPGEIELSSGACEICDLGKYSLEANATECLLCPGGAECTGGADIFPKYGY